MNIPLLRACEAELATWLAHEDSIKEVRAALREARELNKEVIKQSEVEFQDLVEPVSY